MQVVIQGVPERMEKIKKIQAAFSETKVELSLDHEKSGHYGGLVNIINNDCDEYRLIIQDDVILSPMFEDYLPQLEKIMIAEGIDVLSLFAPRRIPFLHKL